MFRHVLNFPVFAYFTIEIIGNETGHLFKFVGLRRKYINKSETYHMLRSDIAASSPKILRTKFNRTKCNLVKVTVKQI